VVGSFMSRPPPGPPTTLRSVQRGRAALA
jgi:hypothetical protein